MHTSSNASITPSSPTKAKMISFLAIFATIFLAITVADANPVSADSTLITDLPGLNHTALNFDMHSGYITVNATSERKLFYWLVEHESPTTAPLMVWLNGGPGCSSLTGLLQEHGPFYPTKDGASLELNEYSWNKLANVLYIESPAGVGFSTSQDSADYKVGDSRTASDLVAFMVGFLAEYPHFKAQEFYISGESYGGHYVPTFAKGIVNYNKKQAALGGDKINFKGFLVGNAWTDAKLDNQGAVHDWHGHSIISTEVHDGIMNNCDFEHIGPLYEDEGEGDDACSDFLGRAHTEMGEISIYEIYQDVCRTSSSYSDMNEMSTFMSYLAQHDMPIGRVSHTILKKRHGDSSSDQSITIAVSEDENENGLDDPCETGYVSKYMNRKDVQTAIHVTAYMEWSMCSGVIQYSRDDLLNSMLPIYQELLKENLHILVFSGDVDGIVPTPGTDLWISELVTRGAIKKMGDLVPWMVDKQVGGRLMKFSNGFTFASVRNAGHLVAGIQPARAYAMLESYFKGDM